MQDFGFNVTLNGTITLLAERIPIFGILLLIGGLGLSSLNLFKNNVANSNRKF